MAVTQPVDVLNELKAEFGSSTDPSPAGEADIEAYLDQIFGTSRIENSVLDFVGTGAPSGFIDFTIDHLGDNFYEFSVTVNDVGGLSTTVQFDWDTDSNFGSPSTESAGSSSTNGHIYSVNTPQLILENTTYYVRARIYNNYNEVSGDHMIMPISGSDSFVTGSLCDNPANAAAFRNTLTDEVTITWQEPANLPDGYRIYHRVNSGSWVLDGSVSSGTTSFSAGTLCSYGVDGDVVQWEVRSVCGGSETSGDLTNTLTLSGCGA